MLQGKLHAWVASSVRKRKFRYLQSAATAAEQHNEMSVNTNHRVAGYAMHLVAWVTACWPASKPLDVWQPTQEHLEVKLDSVSSEHAA